MDMNMLPGNSPLNPIQVDPDFNNIAAWLDHHAPPPTAAFADLLAALPDLDQDSANSPSSTHASCLTPANAINASPAPAAAMLSLTAPMRADVVAICDVPLLAPRPVPCARPPVLQLQFDEESLPAADEDLSFPPYTVTKRRVSDSSDSSVPAPVASLFSNIPVAADPPQLHPHQQQKPQQAFLLSSPPFHTAQQAQQHPQAQTHHIQLPQLSQLMPLQSQQQQQSQATVSATSAPYPRKRSLDAEPAPAKRRRSCAISMPAYRPQALPYYNPRRPHAHSHSYALPSAPLTRSHKTQFRPSQISHSLPGHARTSTTQPVMPDVFIDSGVYSSLPQLVRRGCTESPSVLSQR